VDGRAIVFSRTFPSSDYPSLTEIVRAFVGQKSPDRLRAACFGIAGPIVNGVVKTTNLPWVIDANDFRELLGGVPVRLINDLEAIAYGVPVAGDDAFVTLNAGNPTVRGNAAVIAAGTGLGEAGLFWDGRAYRPFASEGGHASFAPRGSRPRAARGRPRLPSRARRSDGRASSTIGSRTTVRSSEAF